MAAGRFQCRCQQGGSLRVRTGAHVDIDGDLAHARVHQRLDNEGIF